MIAKDCAQCGTPLKTSVAKKRYCSRTCNNAAQAARKRAASRTTCEHCSGPMVQTTGRQRYCSGRCRKAAFVARHAGEEQAPLDADGEILVRDLEDAPRRLRVAKLFDLYEGAGTFEHFTTPQWVRPQDKRQGR